MSEFDVIGRCTSKDLAAQLPRVLDHTELLEFVKELDTYAADYEFTRALRDYAAREIRREDRSEGEDDTVMVAFGTLATALGHEGDTIEWPAIEAFFKTLDAYDRERARDTRAETERCYPRILAERGAVYAAGWQAARGHVAAELEGTA